MLMAASVEPIGARIYWKACKAVSLVSFLAATEDFHPTLCAFSHLVAPTVALFAEVCSCTGKRKWVNKVYF